MAFSRMEKRRIVVAAGAEFSGHHRREKLLHKVVKWHRCPEMYVDVTRWV
jgi:hypothetical protein